MTAKEFWDDFKIYEKDFRRNLLNANHEKIWEPFQYLCSQMNSYCAGLIPNIAAPEKGEGKNVVLTVSCAGDRNLFLHVKRLVNEAPKLKHWEILALAEGRIKTNPKILKEPFKFEGFSITPKDIQFSVKA